MAASRKLQGEIDRCLKKVAEGVEQFEDIWKKVYNATNSNQKEKYEADLKKEIKKLQRLRDQIKSWLTSAEIKDKTQLLENRKLIETQMERFKVVERETKTKAYSKEGLGAALNKDPATKERDEAQRWLNDCIETLSMQADQFEGEIEILTAAGKKKKIDKDKNDRIEGLRDVLEKHRFHIKKLEVLLRMLTNDAVDCEQIKMIKDDIEYYIESCQEPDFVENDGIYDDIEMDDLDFPPVEVNIGKSGKGGSQDSTEGSTPSSSVCGSSPAPSPAITNIHSNENDSHNNQNNNASHNDRKKGQKSEDSRSTRGGSQNNTPVKPQVVRPSNTSSAAMGITNHSSKATPPPSTPTKPVSGNASQNTPNNSSSNLALHNHVNTASQHNRDSSHTNTGSTNHNITNSHGTNSHSATPVASHVNGPTSNCSSSNNNLPAISKAITTSMNSIATPTNQSSKSHTNLVEQNVSLKAIAQKKLNEVNPSLNSTGNDRGSSSLITSSLTTNVSSMIPAISTSSNISTVNSIMTSIGSSSISSTSGKSSSATTEAHIPLLLGVAPLGPVHLSDEHKMQAEQVKAAFYHMPHPSDSERYRMHFPRQPYQTPSYYPQVPPPSSDTVEFFTRLQTETLFFIFYYMEGTKAQYLAAKALKKQSWRFHTKFMMWFQRHEEPRSITDEYEQGTYIFFDCENWGQRKRENFVFEYRFLEDRELN